MYPLVMIAIGAAVLAFGKRLAVLGAAVGALLGVVLMRLLPGSSDPLLELLVIILLAVIGFFAAGFAKGIIDIVLLVVGALAGASIVMAFFDLFQVESSPLVWLVAVLGGVVGLILVRRFKDWALIVLAGLIGGLLITRGLAVWLPFLQESLWGTLLVLVLAAGGVAYQGGFLARRRAAKKTPAAATTVAAAQPPAAPQAPADIGGHSDSDKANSNAPPSGS